MADIKNTAENQKVKSRKLRTKKTKERDPEDDEETYNDHVGGGGPGRARDFRKPRDTRGTMLRVLSYTLSDKKIVGVVLIMMAISSVCSLASSYFLKPIIDDYIFPDFDAKGLATRLVMLAAIYLAAIAATYFQSRLMVNLAQRTTNRIRADLFDKLQNLPISYFDAHTHGELMSRFTNDMDNVQIALEQVITNFITSIITFVGTICLMIYVSWKMFIITMVVIAAAMVIVKRMGKKSKRLFKRQQASLGMLNGYIEELVEDVKVVKAFNYEEQSEAEFQKLNLEYQGNATAANTVAMKVMPIMNSLMNGCYAVTAVAGGLFVIATGGLAGAAGSFTVGSLGVYLNYTKQVAQPINNMSNQVVNLLSALAGAERIFRVIDTDPELDEGNITLMPVVKNSDGTMTETDKLTGAWAWKIPMDEYLTKVDLRKSGMSADLIYMAAGNMESDDPEITAAQLAFREGMARHGECKGKFQYIELKGDVRLKDVHFEYVENKPVLKGITVRAKPGEKIAFVGSTGAGKTTITNLINRFYDIQSGTITYDSIDIKDIKKDDLRHSLGIVLQDTNLFTGTVMDNIRYGRLEATDEECIKAAKDANADGFIRKLPHGYDTVISANGGNLSQGQRQLLAIARAAVANPPVMILDEATSSIDTRTEKHIEKGMDALMQNRTVFVIAHRLSTVKNSQSIAVLEHGEIIEQGSHQELLEQKGRYYLLYTGQNELE